MIRSLLNSLLDYRCSGNTWSSPPRSYLALILIFRRKSGYLPRGVSKTSFLLDSFDMFLFSKSYYSHSLSTKSSGSRGTLWPSIVGSSTLKRLLNRGLIWFRVEAFRSTFRGSPLVFFSKASNLIVEVERA